MHRDILHQHFNPRYLTVLVGQPARDTQPSSIGSFFFSSFGLPDLGLAQAESRHIEELMAWGPSQKTPLRALLLPSLLLCGYPSSFSLSDSLPGENIPLVKFPLMSFPASRAFKVELGDCLQPKAISSFLFLDSGSLSCFRQPQNWKRLPKSQSKILKCRKH